MLAALALLAAGLLQQSIMAKSISKGLAQNRAEMSVLENELSIKEKTVQNLSEIEVEEESVFLPDHLEFACEAGVQIFSVRVGKSTKYETVVVKRVP